MFSRERVEKRIVKLEKYRQELLNAPTITISFDSVKHTLDAAGDLSGAFEGVKNEFMKEIDFDLKDARERLAKIYAEEWWGND